jgi:hypothetical protein
MGKKKKKPLSYNSRMSKPVLLIIAGCNGSGKSTFPKPLAPDNFTPFDYDYQFLRFYNSLIDSDLKET